MSVRTKNRRKIIVDNRLYLWYVALDNNSPYCIFHIVSDDKSVILDCPLKAETSYIISKGRIFQNQDTDGKWHRYFLPFRIPEIITPQFVREIIEWSVQNDEATEVAWNGRNIPI